MVLLTVTAAAKTAIDEYCESKAHDEILAQIKKLSTLELGSPIEHSDVIEISSFLTQRPRESTEDARQWRLDYLLRGAIVYQPPPPTKPEPTSQYKALMKRLRQEEEQRQYERMINPPAPHELGGQSAMYGSQAFNPATSIGQGPDSQEVDDVTFADVNRQMALIINVLVSIIACSVAIWIAARRWDVPQRLGLSMTGSGLVAAAEVAIYMGYIRRIKDAKSLEQKVVESKEVVQSWVLEGTTGAQKVIAADSMRFRKGKHR